MLNSEEPTIAYGMLPGMMASSSLHVPRKLAGRVTETVQYYL
jgi:hypothetical protein